MNNKQRKELQGILDSLNELKERIELITEEEQEKLENFPENMQSSERYEKMESSISNLEEAVTNLESAVEEIQNSIE